MNPETKSYAAVSACEAVIRSIERGVLDREMGNTSQSCESRWPSWSMDDRSMFEPRLLTEEEAHWRASCGWHVDESAVVVALIFRQLGGCRCLGLTAEDQLCDDKGNRNGAQQKAKKLHC